MSEEQDQVLAREEARLMRALSKKKSQSSIFGGRAVKPKKKKAEPQAQEVQEEEEAKQEDKGASVDSKAVEDALAKQEAIDQAVREREAKQEAERRAAKAAERGLAHRAASLTSFGGQGTKLNVVDPEAVQAALSNLHDAQSDVNWVLLGYGEKKNDVVLLEAGTTGIGGLRERLDEKAIQFAVVSLSVKQGGYKSNKFTMLTSIGSGITAGMAKARASGHKAELITFAKSVLSIGGELQISEKDELTEKAVASSLGISLSATSFSKVQENESAPAMSSPILTRSHSRGGRGLQSIEFVDNAAIDTALRSVQDGEAEWVVLQMQGNEVSLHSSGKGGAASLAALYPSGSEIYFGIISVSAGKLETVEEYDGSGDAELRKVAIVTMVGPTVKPLHKARVSGHKDKVAQRVKQVMPFHSHFQADDAEDITDAAILRKLGIAKKK